MTISHTNDTATTPKYDAPQCHRFKIGHSVSIFPLLIWTTGLRWSRYALIDDRVTVVQCYEEPPIENSYKRFSPRELYSVQVSERASCLFYFSSPFHFLAGCLRLSKEILLSHEKVWLRGFWEFRVGVCVGELTLSEVKIPFSHLCRTIAIFPYDESDFKQRSLHSMSKN